MSTSQTPDSAKPTERSIRILAALRELNFGDDFTDTDVAFAIEGILAEHESPPEDSPDCSPKRSALHASRGKPVLSLEFEVFAGEEVSMWTHFNHGTPFAEAEADLTAIQEHLAKFIRDRAMCPFHRPTD